MKTYDAVVLYRTPGRKCLKRPVGGVIAKDTREARRKALMLFEGERGKKAVDFQLIGITLEERPSVIVKTPPPWAQPSRAPIQNGEQVTVQLTGTLELEAGETNDVFLRSPRGQRLRVSRRSVEAHVGRPIAPPPPVVKVEYYSLYPSQYCYGSDRPIQSSQHGLDQLVQVRVTRHDGKIVAKEIV